jgi:hypothetical protein
MPRGFSLLSVLKLSRGYGTAFNTENAEGRREEREAGKMPASRSFHFGTLFSAPETIPAALRGYPNWPITPLGATFFGGMGSCFHRIGVLHFAAVPILIEVNFD